MKIIKASIVSILVLASVILPFVFPMTAYATDPPDNDPTIDNVHCFRNLRETGDVAIFGDYSIPYGVIPDEPSDFTYMIILIDSTGNQTGFTTPYPYFYNGYNSGSWSMYFDADLALPWAAAYTIRIAQSPAYFTTPETFDFELPIEAWCTQTTQELNRQEFYTAVIESAERLETEYTDYTLLEAGITDTVLYSPTGENYYRNVVKGLQVLVPQLFYYQIIPYDTDIPAYSTNMSDNYTNRYIGTDVGNDIVDTGTQFGFSGNAVMALIFSLPTGLFFVIASAKKFHKIEPGLLIFSLIIMMTFMMGWMPAAIFATVYQLIGIYLSYVWFFARSS